MALEDHSAQHNAAAVLCLVLFSQIIEAEAKKYCCIVFLADCSASAT